MPGQPPDNPTPDPPEQPGPDRDAASAVQGRGGAAGLDRVAELIERYHDGDTGPDDLSELREALMRSAAARELFAQLSLQRQVLAEALASDYAEMDHAEMDGAAKQASAPPASASDSALGLGVVPASDRGFMNLLSELDRGSDQAELVDVGAIMERWRDEHRRANAVDRGEVLALLRPYAVWAGGVAALLAVAVTLVVVLLQLGQGPQAPPTTAERETQTDRPAPARPTAVATLTAAHDAQWAAFKPRAGDTLYAGQRFTLTEGFAEITTAGGAVAILEAPATIELTDNDNALRLHAGNLVGICETESSKGFLVRTPHMDITDLGTRFAIAVEPDAEHGEAQSASEVIVMDGKVRVQPSPEAGVAFEPVQLSASESVRCETSGRGLLPTKRAAADFYRSIPDAYEQYVRAQDPVGYWRFEEDRALSLISNLGHSGDRLTRIGRVEPDPRGAVGGSARFDGQSRVELSAPRGLDLTHSFTIASWVYLEPGDDGIQRVFSNGLLRNGKPKAGFGLGVDRLSTDRAYAFFTFYGIADYRSSTAALPTGRWVHLAVSVDRAGQPTFYIDGIAERHQLRSNPSEQNPPPSGRPSDADAWIADAQVGANSPGEAFQGRIDELVILPKPLSSEQIEWLAQRPGIQP